LECEIGDPSTANLLLITGVLLHPGLPLTHGNLVLGIGFTKHRLAGFKIYSAKVEPFSDRWV
jgi:hypothetical protein